MGSNAGYTATTPSDIVSIGTYSASCMTTGTDSVYIGSRAGHRVEAAADNVAIGAWTLQGRSFVLPNRFWKMSKVYNVVS